MTDSLTPAEIRAIQILEAYHNQLEWTAPERTIHQCRELFLQTSERTMADFTAGLKYLLEKRYLKRLTDERLELTATGRDWLVKHRS